jgi:hypothetical protein
MEKNPEPIKEILDELFSLLETLETQSLGLTQFLKDQGIATDEKLAPYLDRAGNASSVKWRAARARMQYLLSPVAKKSDDQEKEKEKEKDKNKEPEKPAAKQSAPEQGQKSGAEKPSTEKPPTAHNKPKNSDAAKDPTQNKNPIAEKDQKPAAADTATKSDTGQKSKRE